jgi:hypothetical protein
MGDVVVALEFVLSDVPGFSSEISGDFASR